MSKIYGYARCSLAEEKGQDLNRQVRELKAAGAKEIVTEREHGDKVKQNLDLLLLAAEEGSTLICCEVSRLSRSTQQLCEIIEIIKTKHNLIRFFFSLNAKNSFLSEIKRWNKAISIPSCVIPGFKPADNAHTVHTTPLYNGVFSSPQER